MKHDDKLHQTTLSYLDYIKLLVHQISEIKILVCKKKVEVIRRSGALAFDIRDSGVRRNAVEIEFAFRSHGCVDLSPPRIQAGFKP